LSLHLHMHADLLAHAAGFGGCPTKVASDLLTAAEGDNLEDSAGDEEEEEQEN